MSTPDDSHTFDLIVQRMSNRCMEVTITVDGETDPDVAREKAEAQAPEKAHNTDFSQFSEEAVHYEIERP